MAWTNWKELRGVFSKERIFLWKVEDMLLIGSRIHRPNSDRRCKEDISDNEVIFFSFSHSAKNSYYDFRLG